MIESKNIIQKFYNPENETTIKYKELSEKEYNTLNKKYTQYWEIKDISKKPKFSEKELGFFLYHIHNGRYMAINNIIGIPHIESFEEKKSALRFLSGENLDKLREEERIYKILIYKTKEDYNKKTFFEHNRLSDLEEAKYELDDVMKYNSNYYFGFVINQKTGIVEYNYFNSEHQYKLCIYETEEDWNKESHFDYNLSFNFEEAMYKLENIIKLNNYYSGAVIDKKTGNEEYSFYNEEYQEESEDNVL